jgi:hypothetical protein
MEAKDADLKGQYRECGSGEPKACRGRRRCLRYAPSFAISPPCGRSFALLRRRAFVTNTIFPFGYPSPQVFGGLTLSREMPGSRSPFSGKGVGKSLNSLEWDGLFCATMECFEWGEEI